MRLARWLSLVPVLACQEYTLQVEPKDDDPVVVDTDEGVPLDLPDIEVTPTELLFGSLPPDCPSEPQIVTIRNVGSATLEVSEVALRGVGKTAFRLSDAGPLVLDPLEEAQIEVVFEPEGYYIYDRVRVEVASNDPDEALVAVSTDGEGSVAAFAEELFVQEQAGAVDVLWVIDNSCSMDAELTELGRTMGTFISSFTNLGLDFQIGVTTTDTTTTGARGALLGPIIDQNTANPVAQFQSQTAQGSAGSADEKGFEGSQMALTAPRINSAPNSGLLRPDATLAVVVISDEDDYSSISPSAYVNWLLSMKPDPQDVTFSAMVGPNGGGGLLGGSGCGSAFSTAQASNAPRYHEAIRNTNGVWGDFCAFEINPFLTHLSYVAAGLDFRFPLARDPIATGDDAITVTVDGVEVPWGPVNGWTYDANTNSVEMHGDAIPGPGQVTVVAYPYGADCD